MAPEDFATVHRNFKRIDSPPPKPPALVLCRQAFWIDGCCVRLVFMRNTWQGKSHPLSSRFRSVQIRQWVHIMNIVTSVLHIRSAVLLLAEYIYHSENLDEKGQNAMRFQKN